MLNDEEARVPFAVIGVLLVIVSTIVTVYLMSMESQGITRGISDDRERDFSRALTLAASDIGSALNYAGLSAEAEVGRAPVVNASNGSIFAKYGGSVDDERIKYLAWRQLSKYLEANYNGSFTFGDYDVIAVLTGDYRSLTISPGNMTLGRKFDHPVTGCERNYTAYYTISAPVRLTVREAGSDFEYGEDRVIRSLIASRYPLLRELTGEYEQRLNGTPMFLDLTAASFAYTWARGYAQYAFGAPLNIVDNSQIELIVNGAALMEQGFEYNSVDPLGLATLAYKCIGNAARPSEINCYDADNNSGEGLPQNRTGPPSKNYTFNVDEMVDRAYDNVSFGGYSKNTFDGAYTACMYVEIKRDRDCYPRVNATCVSEEKNVLGPPAGPGEWPLLARTFRVYHDDSDGKGFADRVSVTYIVTRYSVLQYFGAGRYTDSSENIGDPVLSGSSNDVARPFGPYTYEKDLSFGHKAFTDDNLRDVVKWYESSFDIYGGPDFFERTLADITGDRDGWQARVPSLFTDRSYEFVCGPDNQRPVWVEIESDYELRDLCNAIKKEVTVNLDPEIYGGAPAAMTQDAYRTLDSLYRSGYDRYLDRQSYFCASQPGDYCNWPAYRSCGSKAIFRIREAFLEDLLKQIDDAAGNASGRIDRTIEERMNGTGLNASDLTAGAAGAKSYLKEHFYIPFGLAMTLNSSAEFACGYPWDEGITLAIDQSPSYLDTGRHTDEETGYSARTLRLRNVCLFSPSADISWTGEIGDAMAGPFLSGVDAIAASVDSIANRTVIAEVDSLAGGVSCGIRGVLKEKITAALGESAGTKDVAPPGSVEQAVERAYDRRGNDSRAIIRDLSNGTLVKEIAGDIVNASSSAIREKARTLAEGYVDDYAAYFARMVGEKVARAERKAIAQVTGRLKNEIRTVFRDFAREAAQDIAARGANAALEKALGLIPSGLPLLPPWGWWATLNVWYIEVQGEIPVFTVYDADAETVPDPVFGGRAISYTRRHQVVLDDRGQTIGRNEPVRFRAKTGTFILVPPGAQGVGDRTGGWDEKSPGYDEPEEIS